MIIIRRYKNSQEYPNVTVLAEYEVIGASDIAQVKQTIQLLYGEEAENIPIRIKEGQGK